MVSGSIHTIIPASIQGNLNLTAGESERGTPEKNLTQHDYKNCKKVQTKTRYN